MRRPDGSRRRTTPTTRARDERGVVLPIVAVMLSVLVLIAAFGVDLGMQRVARRDMQALADAVALDLARLLDGRTAAQIQAGNARSMGIEAAKNASEQRNEGSALGDDPVVEWTLVTLDLRGDPVRAPDGTVSSVSGGAVPDAVLVTARTSVDFAFATGSGAAGRSAIGVASTTACHRLGSFVAALNTGDAAALAQLNEILHVNLSLVSYQGLADVGVSLADLALEMGAGDIDSLLTGYVSYASLVKATIDVLNKKKPTGYAAAVTTLGAVLGAAGGIGAVRLGNVLSISPDDRAALATKLNVLDLLAGSVLVADGTHAVSLPNLQAQVPGLGNHFTGSLNIVAAAQLACGEPNSPVARARNSQLVGDLGMEFINLPSLNIDAGVLKGTLQTAKGTGALHVALGNAQSQLIDPPRVSCGAGTVADPSTFSVSVASGLAQYSLDSEVEAAGKLKIGVGPLAVTADVVVVVGLSLRAPGTTGSVVAPLSIPPHDRTPYRTGSPVSLLTPVVPVIKSASVTVGGVSVDALTKTLVTDAIVASLTVGNNNFTDRTLRPLAANIDTQLIGPSAALLGLRVGGADVYAVSASCGTPALAG